MRYILEERLAFYTKKDRARKETYLKRYYILHEQEKHSRKNKEGKTERTKTESLYKILTWGSRNIQG
jgi:hypothetical protein